MTALGKLLRTTAFKLTLAYSLAFVSFSVVTIGYVAWNTERLLEAQITETIETEINSLAEQYRQGGMRRLVPVIERRGRQPGSFLYLVIDPRGETLTGNAQLDEGQGAITVGWQETRYRRPDEPADVTRMAKVRAFVLPGQLKLLVGRDLEERLRLNQVFRRARRWTIAVAILFGGLAAVFVTRRVLKRVDQISNASDVIIGGNLKERLPIAGVGDEFDRLSQSLNRMLDRIGELMAGLREVSDNIAHDLRTPLTRLRNHAEEALRADGDADHYRAALERTIEESEELIRIFDALLLIARAEAGSVSATMQDVDAGELLRNLAELYEPLAEEAGMPLAVVADGVFNIRANRELIGQAVSNLIDNALKYGKPANGNGALLASVARAGERIEIAVTDRGPGIPEADRQRVLDRFVRLEASRASPGFGLGLSLVAAVARLHGGQLRLEEAAPGLRAVLSLPALADGPPVAAPFGPPAGAAVPA